MANNKSDGIKRLYRSREDKVLWGVCGGMAKYLEVDPVIVRLIWVIFSLASLGMGVIIYLIATLIIPKEPTSKR